MKGASQGESARAQLTRKAVITHFTRVSWSAEARDENLPFKAGLRRQETLLLHTTQREIIVKREAIA